MSFNDAVQAFEEGRYEEALVHFRALVADNPGDADLHYNIACCLVMMGRPGEAREALERAITLNPNYETDARMDSDLARLLPTPPGEAPQAPGEAGLLEDSASPEDSVLPEGPAQSEEPVEPAGSGMPETEEGTAPATGVPATSESPSPPPPGQPTPKPGRSMAPAGRASGDCERCGQANPPAAVRCRRCGTPLSRRQPLMTDYRNYLPLSIVLTVIASGTSLMFCCLPLGLIGIVAIVYAGQAQTFYQSGDFARATGAARTAKIWCLVTAVVGAIPLAGLLAYGLFFLFAALLGP